jgi:hypothetical protein
MFLEMVLYNCDLFFGLSSSSPFFSTTTFRGMDDEGRAIPRNVVVEKKGDDEESPKSRSQLFIAVFVTA